MNGALLIRKPAQITSFGVLAALKRSLQAKTGISPKNLPKLGHGGTLDPFATGLLIVLVGRGVKLARYFLGATKGYGGQILFGQSTVPGDPTEAVTETSSILPESLEQIQHLAHLMTRQPYLQTPPMHSAKKVNGRPLYELAREGIEIEREPRVCHLYSFDILRYEASQAEFHLRCSSGTYVRTLAQDLSRLLNTVGMLNSLHRTQSGVFQVSAAWDLDQVLGTEAPWDQLPCWVPFDQLLCGYPSAEASLMEHQALLQGKQSVLFSILKRVTPPQEYSSQRDQDCVAIYQAKKLVAIARSMNNEWGLERVIT